jgi:hypothetical protein
MHQSKISFAFVMARRLKVGLFNGVFINVF